MEEGDLKDLAQRRTAHVQSDYAMHVKFINLFCLQAWTRTPGI